VVPLKSFSGHANDISSSAITQLEAIASNSASGDGDPSPASALAVLTTTREALTAITSDEPGMEAWLRPNLSTGYR